MSQQQPIQLSVTVNVVPQNPAADLVSPRNRLGLSSKANYLRIAREDILKTLEESDRPMTNTQTRNETNRIRKAVGRKPLTKQEANSSLYQLLEEGSVDMEERDSYKWWHTQNAI